MTAFLSIGSGTNSQNPADDLLPVVVRKGDTVTIKIYGSNPSTVKYQSSGHSGGVTGTVAANAIGTVLTIPGTHFLQCAGRADIRITGGVY